MKKLIYKYLSGFAFGAMMLVLCFLLTYSFGGQTYYEQELGPILNPKSYFLQTIWAGILYVSITVTLINTHEFLKVEDNDVTVQYLIMFTIHILIILGVSLLAQKYGDFGLGVYSLLFGLGMIFLMTGTLADMFQNLIKLIKLNRKVFVLKPEAKNGKKTSTKK